MRRNKDAGNKWLSNDHCFIYFYKYFDHLFEVCVKIDTIVVGCMQFLE